MGRGGTGRRRGRENCDWDVKSINQSINQSLTHSINLPKETAKWYCNSKATEINREYKANKINTSNRKMNEIFILTFRYARKSKEASWLSERLQTLHTGMHAHRSSDADRDTQLLREDERIKRQRKIWRHDIKATGRGIESKCSLSKWKTQTSSHWNSPFLANCQLWKLGIPSRSNFP